MVEENVENDILDEFEEDILEDESKSRSKKLISIAAAVVVLFIIGGYYLYSILVFQPPTVAPPIKKELQKIQPILPPPQETENINERPGPEIPTQETGEKDYTKAAPVVKDKIQEIVKEESIEEIPPQPVHIASITDGSKELYAVQVGSYVYEASVKTVRKILSKIGLDPYRKEGVTNISIYQILIGKFQYAEEVTDIVQRLSSEGIQVKFEKVNDELYTISVASHFDSIRAEDTKRDLILKGYPARVDVSTKKSKVHILRLGDYTSKTEALSVVKKVKEVGITPFIVKVRK